MSYVRQIIYLIIYFRYFRNCLVLSICWDIRIYSCWLLHFMPLFSRIQAVRLPLCFLVLSGCSPLFVLSSYHESHSFSQPAIAVTVSLSLSAMWPASQYSNTHYLLSFILGALPSYSTLPNHIDAVTHFLFIHSLSHKQTLT